MKALIVEQYGAPQNAHVADVEAPSVKDGFLLVRMRAAAVNPFDYKIVTGAVKDWIHVAFPYVPGMDGAGDIAAVGGGVQGWEQGDAVVGMFPRGTFAQYALIKASEKRLAKKPPNLEYERAAAIPESALTARTMVRASGLRSGQIALVIGATGGVGHFVLQLGKMEGARVVATGKADDAAYLRDLGADETVDYAAGDVAEQVRRRYPDGIDAVFDVVDSGDALLEVATVLRTPGTLISTLSGPAQDAFPQGISVHYVQLSAQEGDLDDLVRRAADGSLRVEIGGVYDLAQAGQALADLSDRTKHTKGKLVVRIP